MRTFYCNDCDTEFTEEEQQIHQNHFPDEIDICIYCGSDHYHDTDEE